MYVHCMHVQIKILTEIHLIYKQCREAPIKKPLPKHAGHKDTTKMKKQKTKKQHVHNFVFFLTLAIELKWCTQD